MGSNPTLSAISSGTSQDGQLEDNPCQIIKVGPFNNANNRFKPSQVVFSPVSVRSGAKTARVRGVSRMIVESFEWRSAALTNPGLVRKVNEDAFLDAPEMGLWVVADGMGGHQAGDYASRLIVEQLGDVENDAEPDVFLSTVEARLQEVNTSLFEKAQASASTIGSTVVALLAFKRYCLCLWAGDSRVYRLRNGEVEQITRDHSQVEELIALGEIPREEADSHPMANVITRAVGGASTLNLDANLQPLRNRDRIMLCSDGLYKDIGNEEILEGLNQSDPERACKRLVELALRSGGGDNISVAVIDFLSTDSSF
ncbi:MAG: PP2C family serine/threonine-protein phosphatase [Gammaproteobacteria bacterium]